MQVTHNHCNTNDSHHTYMLALYMFKNDLEININKQPPVQQQMLFSNDSPKTK